LPRVLAGEAQRALAGEPLIAGTIIEPDPAKRALGAALVTPTRFIVVVDKRSSRSWPLSEVTVTDYQQQASGHPPVLAVLADSELLRFRAPRGYTSDDLHDVFEELEKQDSPLAAARAAELSWWETKAAWPYGALGRVAGGTTTLEPGQKGSIGLGWRGVSVYLGRRDEPTLLLPWADVTDIFVEGTSELNERLGATRLQALGLLEWGLSTTQGESFVTVTTKREELYFAVQAPVPQLREHWAAVLDKYVIEPEDALVSAEDDAPDEVVMPELADPPRPLDPGVAGQLERLAALYASGALTEEEYAAAKAAAIEGH
jgi:hypothetical protein